MPELLFEYAGKTEQELNAIIDTGVFNEIIKGYLVIALQDIDKPRAEILEALSALEAAFDDADAECARNTYRKL